jgi:hypothetical protein
MVTCRLSTIFTTNFEKYPSSFYYLLPYFSALAAQPASSPSAIACTSSFLF